MLYSESPLLSGCTERTRNFYVLSQIEFLLRNARYAWQVPESGIFIRYSRFCQPTCEGFVLNYLHRMMARLFVVGGVLLLPAAVVPDAHVPASRYAEDPRASALRSFLAAKDSPIEHLTEDFLIVADRYGLDWRLLPSIAFLESSAGKLHRNNNIFGWNNANTRFTSIREGIYYVGARLGEGEIYRGRSMAEKLALYNPYDHYAPAVFRVANHLAHLEQEARTRSTTVFSGTIGSSESASRSTSPLPEGRQ